MTFLKFGASLHNVGKQELEIEKPLGGVQEFLLVLSTFLDRFKLNLVQTTCV